MRDIGRVYTDPVSRIPYFDWSLSGICFRYFGRVLTGHFIADCGTEPSGISSPPGTAPWTVWPRVAVYLDDDAEPHRVFSVDRADKDEIIFSSDRKEDHVIRIVKLTEALKTGVGVDSFFGDGQMIAPRLRKRPLIEFVGDSISVGFGNLARPETPGFFSEHQDPTLAYPALAARELGYNFSIIGYSGICAGFRRWNRVPYSMLDLYAYTDRIRQDRLTCGCVAAEGETGQTEKSETEPEAWDFKHHRADYVFINLGSNDASAIRYAAENTSAVPDGETITEDRFDACYYDLIAKIREKNGRYAKIICALGDMDYYLYDNIIRAAERFIRDTGDTKVYTLKLSNPIFSDIRGALNHPGMDANRRMATQVVSFIRELEAGK